MKAGATKSNRSRDSSNQLRGQLNPVMQRALLLARADNRASRSAAELPVTDVLALRTRWMVRPLGGDLTPEKWRLQAYEHYLLFKYQAIGM